MGGGQENLDSSGESYIPPSPNDKSYFHQPPSSIALFGWGPQQVDDDQKEVTPLEQKKLHVIIKNTVDYILVRVVHVWVRSKTS